MQPLLTVKDVAARLHVEERTVYDWIHIRYIPFVKLGGLVRFKEASIEEWIDKLESPGRAKRRLEIDAE